MLKNPGGQLGFSSQYWCEESYEARSASCRHILGMTIPTDGGSPARRSKTFPQAPAALLRAGQSVWVMLTLKNRFYIDIEQMCSFSLSLYKHMVYRYTYMYVCTPSYTIIYIHTYVRYILVSNIVLIHYLQSTIWTQQSPNRQVQILPSLPSQQPKPRRRSPNDPKKRSRSAKSQKSWE